MLFRFFIRILISRDFTRNALDVSRRIGQCPARATSREETAEMQARVRMR